METLELILGKTRLQWLGHAHQIVAK